VGIVPEMLAVGVEQGLRPIAISVRGQTCAAVYVALSALGKFLA
jgi:hypothetical protein